MINHRIIPKAPCPRSSQAKEEVVVMRRRVIEVTAESRPSETVGSAQGVWSFCKMRTQRYRVCLGPIWLEVTTIDDAIYLVGYLNGESAKAPKIKRVSP